MMAITLSTWKQGPKSIYFHNYSWMYNHVKCFYKHAFTYGTLHNTEFFSTPNMVFACSASRGKDWKRVLIVSPTWFWLKIPFEPSCTIILITIWARRNKTTQTVVYWLRSMLAFVLGVKLKLNIKNQACEGLAKLQKKQVLTKTKINTCPSTITRTFTCRFLTSQLCMLFFKQFSVTHFLSWILVV